MQANSPGSGSNSPFSVHTDVFGDIPAVSIIKQIITVMCHSSGNWIPDPAQFTCSPSTTVPSGIQKYYRSILNQLIHSSDSKHLSHYLRRSTIVKG